MSIRTIATFAVAIFLGLIAVFLTRSIIANRQTEAVPAAAGAGMVPVVVAAEPLGRGEPVEAGKLRVVNFPVDAVPADAFQSIPQLLGGGTRLAMGTIAKNEPILAAMVTSPGGKLAMSTELTPGMRAVSIKSGDVAGVAGFVLPGDRVDVLLTRTMGGQGNDNANSLTQVIAEDVRVLAVDQTDDEGANKPVVAKTVTVEVTPDQAQKISLGDSVGTISLALRHVADSALITRDATTVRDLGFAPRAPMETGGGIRVIRGGDASQQAYGAAPAKAGDPAGAGGP